MKVAERITKSLLGGRVVPLRIWAGQLKRTFVAIVSSSLILLVYSGFTGTGRAPDVTPVVATFTDNLDDNIRSDGGGAYLDGVDGVRCVIDLLDDFILQLHFNGKKTAPRRQMFFDFTEPVAGSGAINRGTFYDDAFLNVDSIGTLAVGQSRSSQAQFNTEIGLLRFNPVSYPGTSNVLVTRTSDATWVITASTATGGDVAALVQQSRGNTLKHVGNYHMPFQITLQFP